MSHFSRLASRLAPVAALAAWLGACGGGGVTNVATLEFDPDLPKPHDYPIHGIDVSKYQGDDRLERGRLRAA